MALRIKSGAKISTKQFVELKFQNETVCVEPDSSSKINGSTLRNVILGKGCSTLLATYFYTSEFQGWVDSYTFRDCIALREVKFPRSLKQIDPNAFLNCPNLEKVTFADDAEEIHLRNDHGALVRILHKPFDDIEIYLQMGCAAEIIYKQDRFASGLTPKSWTD
ncbi:MAG: leucine-rich repeat protein [Bacteroidaceae bacterium]|nr:leucine-rich repeat protein [Bacteroidaceae bacterium]